jgi:predicted phage tail protein
VLDTNILVSAVASRVLCAEAVAAMTSIMFSLGASM